VLGPEAYAQSEEQILNVLTGSAQYFERFVARYQRWERVSYVPDIDAQGTVAGFFSLVEDITALKQVENQLRIMVRFDSLTGLSNRLQFDEKLVEAIARSRRSERQMAVMFLDIDRFKSINDTLGHHGGDEVLREFAQRLLACVRHTDVVARLAGDEFVIILEGLHAPQEAAVVASKIIQAMAHDFQILGMMRNVTTSIGIAIRDDDEIDPEALLRRADEALYRAKAAGRNTFRGPWSDA
jgi:diguanylate cyclase (GGDEF)-like protein